MSESSRFTIFVADSNHAFPDIAEKELKGKSMNVTKLANKDDFVQHIQEWRADLIFLYQDNNAFSNGKLVEIIRSSEKNHETPIVIVLTPHPDFRLIEQLYKTGANDFIFAFSDKKSFLEKIRFHSQSSEISALVRENIKLSEKVRALEEKNNKLTRLSKQDKKRIQKTNKELARELNENVRSSLELISKTRHLAEKIKELKLSNENYEHITENVQSGIVIIGKEGRLLYANSKAAQIAGYSISELLNVRMKDLLPPDVYQEGKERLISRIDGKNPGNNHITKLTTNDGQLKTIEASGSKTKWMGETADLIVFSDITRKDRLSNLLNIQYNISYLSTIPKNLDESFKQIFDTICGFDWVDGGGVYLMDKQKDGLNLVFQRGLSVEFQQHIQFVPRKSDRFDLLRKKKAIYVSVHESSGISKEVIEAGYKEILIIPLTYNNKIIGSLNLVSNASIGLSVNEKRVFESIGSRITQLITLIDTQDELQIKNKKLQQTLREVREKQQLLIQKSKLESLGEMAAGVAHEINQPLGVIFLSLENILYKISGKNVSQEYLDKKLNSISENVKKVKDIIDHIRTFSRDQKSITIERVDLNTVIRKACSIIDEQYKYLQIAIHLQLDEKVGFVLGNSHKLEQVMYNLFSNAKFALEEKELLPAEKPYNKEIYIRTYIEENKVLIELEDNGIGIDNKNLDNIFNPFFTTKPEGVGTGLGLSIVYGIITEMKGSIRLISEKNKGTTARIVFPKPLSRS